MPPQRILIIRLDRLGDVVLSTPVIQALRAKFPDAYLAMMVRPACREIIDGNPLLNEVIVYDKDVLHRSVKATWRFARRLRAHHFDTAIVLHPTNRSHWIVRFAGIPMRVGYDRKWGRLLTHRVPHAKQEGEQHEARYTLQLLEPLGIRDVEPHPSVPVNAEAAASAEALLTAAGIALGETIVAIHPSASCISKRWMPQRFAEVADRLIREHGARVCIVAAGPDGVESARQTAAAMAQPVVNLAGRLTIAELAAVLRRCRLLISNDSGPVHVAAALGDPVVDIFGRNQRGLSPRRWGPIGEGHAVLHKEVGCVTCLAHDCDIDFLCLTSITAEEVFRAASEILARPPRRELTFPQLPV